MPVASQPEHEAQPDRMNLPLLIPPAMPPARLKIVGKW